MKRLFSSKNKWVIASVIIVFLIYLYVAQFYFLGPLKSDLTTKQQSLASEQKLLANLEQKVKGASKNVDENTTELQRQIPVESLQDQFVLDLQQAEKVSGSQIKTMSFSEGGQNKTAVGSGNNPAAGTSNNSTNSTSSQSSSSSTASINNQTSGGTSQQQTSQTAASKGTNQQSVPALNKLTAQLAVESPTYEDFEKFIATLEGLKRIVVVENISYTGPEEMTSLSQNTSPFAFSLIVSAYYMPSLSSLQSQLPKAEYPAPANKENPLAQFPDLTTP